MGIRSAERNLARWLVQRAIIGAVARRHNVGYESVYSLYRVHRVVEDQTLIAVVTAIVTGVLFIYVAPDVVSFIVSLLPPVAPEGTIGFGTMLLMFLLIHASTVFAVKRTIRCYARRSGLGKTYEDLLSLRKHEDELIKTTIELIENRLDSIDEELMRKIMSKARGL